jgi:hypothetical protein
MEGNIKDGRTKYILPISSGFGAENHPYLMEAREFRLSAF